MLSRVEPAHQRECGLQWSSPKTFTESWLKKQALYLEKNVHLLG